MSKVKTRPQAFALCARCGTVIKPGDRFDMRVLSSRSCRDGEARARVEITCSAAPGRGGCTRPA